jgi:Reverse transcriptase (RNA-dependent DNA polymerase)
MFFLPTPSSPNFKHQFLFFILIVLAVPFFNFFKHRLLSFVFIVPLLTCTTAPLFSTLHSFYNMSLSENNLSDSLTGIKFGIQNCNSLNMSHSTSQNQKLKIAALLDLKLDVVFLSDLRLGNKNLSTSKNDISNQFLVNPVLAYDLVSNSNKPKRGVGFMFNRNLQYEILNNVGDQDENFIVLLVRIKNATVILASIYGSNTHNPYFFRELFTAIKAMGNYPLIIGGDFNCTYSSDTIQNNIDCLNMADVPNIRHSTYLNEMCEALNVTDPYRYLNPNSREYTYIPFGTVRKNRSRLDFFLISYELISDGLICVHSDSVHGTLFDHKSVIMTLGQTLPKKRRKKRLAISNAILTDTDVDIVGWFAVFETYLHHLNVGPNLQRELNETLTLCGSVHCMLRDAGPDPLYYLFNATEEKILTRSQNLKKIRKIMSEFPVDVLYNFELSVPDDIFMETILNNFRNKITSYQAFIFKFQRLEKVKLIEQLHDAKHKGHTDTADTLEAKLAWLIDQELKSKIEHSSIFSYLNNEKMTPLFLKLSKIASKDASLSGINKDDGTHYNCDRDRHTGILNYYADLYKEKNPPREGLTIESFLGEDIVNNPIVLSSKLSNNQRMLLEEEISLAELDSSINSAKNSSAGGMDGLNNKAIKKFWHLLRFPLYKYTKAVTGTRVLTNSFNSASIKLIPKKGDLTKLKNWRPISLLNCIYKVISRAINARLQKVAPTILSRAQKGFVKNRYIQEVLINVLENIAYANATGTPGLIVAIDQSRAFDTISHAYMNMTYKFFGFGEHFINCLNTFGTNRTACILWEDGSYSETFGLGTGRTQGDGPSPLQYNFGEQTLIFKLELDPRIRPLVETVVLSARVPEPLPWFRSETGKKTRKVEALADDTTVITKNCRGSLAAIKENLSIFGQLSGLLCNFDKTVVMPVGNSNIFEGHEDLGFSIDNKITLLGLNIDSNLDCLRDCFDKTLEKITNTVNFWARFRLSLSGRINIVRTLCLSQLNYIGSIITPEPGMLDSITQKIEKFVKGTLNISKERLYLPVAKGGVGLINLEDFLIAQQVMWVKRTLSACCDNWRSDLWELTHGNPLILSPTLVNRNLHPILYNIAVSFEKFRKAFLLTNDNYKKSNILYNPLLSRHNDGTGTIDAQFFRQIPEINYSGLATLKFNQVFSGGPVLLEQINNNADPAVNLNLATYMRLVGVCSKFVRSLKHNRRTDGTSLDMRDFFNSFKKGSRRTRAILWDSRYKLTPLLGKLTTVKKFFGLIGLPIAEENQLAQLYQIWALHFLPNKFRDFVFKFTNNILGLNVRVVHFTERNDRGCTFCAYNKVQNPPDEVFRHLFYDCNSTQVVLRKFYNKFFQDLGLGAEGQRNLWFGIAPPQVKDKTLLSITVLYIQYLVWDAKLKTRSPNFARINLELSLFLRFTVGIKKDLINNDPSYSLSRNFTQLSGDGLH